MNNKAWGICFPILALSLLGTLCGCAAQRDQAAEAPPTAQVVGDVDLNLFTVEHPEQFPFVTATAHLTSSELVVTGTVTADVSRNVPVVSLASGRVTAIHVRLGDTVQKGQLLLTIRSDDVAGGFDAYHKAVSDELLTREQLDRAKDMYANGAIATQDLEVAQDAEEDAKTTLDTATEHLRLLGNDPTQPKGIVDIVAPISGVVTDQEVTNAATVQAYSTPSPFTISDLSSVWIICDVYENDLATVRVGDTAEVTLNAYPGRTFKGKVSNIGAILDPNIRTAKVRIEVQNPGFMRLGMFAKAIFRGQSSEMHTTVPASSILHMHDRDFVFIPAPNKKFQRLEVVSGDVLPENTKLQEIKSGIKPGQMVVTNALVLDSVLAE